MSEIKHLEVFLEPDGFMEAALAGGSMVSFTSGTNSVVNKGIAQADSTFNLGGALVRFAELHKPAVITVSKMENDAWKQFLDSRGYGTTWKRWFATTRVGRWNVVYWESAEEKVIYENTALPPKNYSSDTPLGHVCTMHVAGCRAPVTWRNRIGQYFCDEHKVTMDFLLRANHHDPGWTRAENNLICDNIAVEKSHNLADLSMVLGIISLICGIFSGIPSIFLGLLAIGKIKKGTASGKGRAISGIIAGSVGTALYCVIYVAMLMEDGTKELKNANNELKYAEAAYYSLGKELASKAPDEKTLLIVEKDRPEDKRTHVLIQAFKDGASGKLNIVSMDTPTLGNLQTKPKETGIPYIYRMTGKLLVPDIYKVLKAKDYDDLIKKYPECTLVVSLIGLPKDYEELQLWTMPPDKRPKLALINCSCQNLKNAVRSGAIIAVAAVNPKAVFDEQPAPSDPNNAFKRRYIMITPENVMEIGDTYKNMFDSEKDNIHIDQGANRQKAEEEAAKIEKDRQEMWDLVAKSANQALADKSNFETAIASLEKIKANSKGTKFENMADIEIAKLAKAKTDLEEEKRRKAEEEQRLAEEAAKKKQIEKDAAALVEKKKSELLEAIASDIMKEDYQGAFAKFTKNSLLMPELKETLEPLSKANEIILASFKNEIGNTISFGAEKMTVKSRIIKVDKGTIYSEQTIGKALIVMKYSLKDLNFDEKIKRLSAVNPAVAAIYKGVSEAKSGKFDDAENSFDNGGLLSQVLKSELYEMKTKIKQGQSPAIDKK
jgi:hypothetical protein